MILQKGGKRHTKRPTSSPASENWPEAELAGVAAFARWFRAEIPSEELTRTTVRAPLRVAPHQRILVAQGASTPEARIQISAGRLAGSQIHLAVTGGRIETLLLTSNEASRQTLVVAMDAVRERLRVRGLIAAVSDSAGVRDGPDRDPEGRETWVAAVHGDRPLRLGPNARRGGGGRG